MIRHRLRWFPALLLLAAAGCAGLSRGSDVCPASNGSVSLPLPDLSGDYRLIMVSTAGPKRNRSVEGTLSLAARTPGETRRNVMGRIVDLSATQPFVGLAALDLTAVGAATEGDLASTDPAAPGAVISVVDSPREGRVVELGLGAGRNRFDTVILDGASTDMRILRADAAGFSGSWRATFSYTDYRARGYFCAIRSSPGLTGTR